jgi:predicted unusual protein kinase regulating ubiquinone biosynthesis (AarF/ABC1/UbiB family)
VDNFFHADPHPGNILLLDAPDADEASGQAGREHVRARFLLPRLVRDSLVLIKSLV